MKKRIAVRVQYAVPRADLPPPNLISKWATSAAQHLPGRQSWEITVRVVGVREMTELNQRYRQRNGATNVLSFNYDLPVHLPQMADIVICAPYAADEATTLGITRDAHWAHLVVHGTLHILGLDHHDPEMAETMEGHETEILSQLGFHNPYQYHEGRSN